MCIAYAGRCLMSAYLTGRSAQSGFCSHTCRWNFSVKEGRPSNEDDNLSAKKLAESGLLLLEEEQRKGEYFPVFEGDNFTAVLSSKDLRMIDNLNDFKKAGVDSLKIEGRMKSVYYVAMVTRAYRKAIDALEGKITAEEARPFIDELENVSHRESTSGFYYNKAEADKTTSGASDSKYQLAAEIGKEITGSDFDKIYELGQKNYSDFKTALDNMHPAAREARLKDLELHSDRRVIPFDKKDGWKMYEMTALNMIKANENIEFVSPDFVSITASPEEYSIINPESGTKLNWVCDGHPCLVYTKYKLPHASLLRTLDPDYIEGKIRDSGR